LAAAAGSQSSSGFVRVELRSPTSDGSGKITLASKRIFISADHGLAIVYFLQSDVVPTLIKGGAEVILLTDDALVERIRQRFGQPGLSVEGLRLQAAKPFRHFGSGGLTFFAGQALRSASIWKPWKVM
jgi:hypothetical protein